MSQHIPESDWKVFRKLRGKALERFCERVLSDIRHLVSDNTRSFHDRYLEIYKLIDARDGELARVFDNPRRSQAVLQLSLIHSHDLLESDELARFTSETRSAIDSISELTRR